MRRGRKGRQSRSEERLESEFLRVGPSSDKPARAQRQPDQLVSELQVSPLPDKHKYGKPQTEEKLCLPCFRVQLHLAREDRVFSSCARESDE